MTLLPKDFYYKSNRLQQLRGFYYTAQLGSVSKAAQRMGVNQSTVTMQIKSLERDLKTKLLKRRGQGVEPTAQGQSLYRLSLPYIEGIDSLYERFYLDAQREKQQIEIVANHASMLHLMPKAISAYKRLYPDIGVTLNNLTREEGYQMIIEDRAHLVVSSINIKELPAEIEYLHIKDYEAILIVRDNHPLLSCAQVAPQDLAQYQLVRMPPEYSTIEMFLETAKTYGWPSDIRLNGSDWEVLKSYVRESDGFTIISRLAYDPKRDVGLKAVSMQQFFPAIRYGIAVKKGRTLPPYLQELIDFLRDPAMTP